MTDNNKNKKWNSFQDFDFHLNKSNENLEEMRKFINQKNYYDAAVRIEFLKDHVLKLSEELDRLLQKS